MKELLYFVFCDVMVFIHYKKLNNCIYYLSHRSLSQKERMVIEQYILTHTALHTRYYTTYPSTLVYSGVNTDLTEQLEKFNKQQETTRSKKEDEAVQAVIHHSLSTYYAEQIGNTIREIKQCAKSNDWTRTPREYKNTLITLIDAYNIHTEKSLTLVDVVTPDVLKILK